MSKPDIVKLIEAAFTGGAAGRFGMRPPNDNNPSLPIPSALLERLQTESARVREVNLNIDAVLADYRAKVRERCADLIEQLQTDLRQLLAESDKAASDDYTQSEALFPAFRPFDCYEFDIDAGLYRLSPKGIATRDIGPKATDELVADVAADVAREEPQIGGTTP